MEKIGKVQQIRIVIFLSIIGHIRPWPVDFRENSIHHLMVQKHKRLYSSVV